MIPKTSWLALTLVSVASGTAMAQHTDTASAPRTITLDAQGGDYPEWFQNPHMVEFYALSVEMLRAKRRVDAAAYERRSFAIFRAFAQSLGANPDDMIQHLKPFRARWSGSSRTTRRCSIATTTSWSPCAGPGSGAADGGKW